MAVPVRLAASSVEAGKPEAIFDVLSGTRFQVFRDRQRFLIALPVEGDPPRRRSSSTPTGRRDWQCTASS
jgi:hypothetical protein